MPGNQNITTFWHKLTERALRFPLNLDVIENGSHRVLPRTNDIASFFLLVRVVLSSRPFAVGMEVNLDNTVIHSKQKYAVLNGTIRPRMFVSCTQQHSLLTGIVTSI